MEDLRLHLGCGSKYLPGYTHIDLLQYEHVDYTASISDLNMFEANSVKEIYACHCLEHFKRFEVRSVLKEWHRVLDKDGVIRLAVPNFESIVAEYNSTKNLNILLGLVHGGQNYEYNIHYMSFDFFTLKNLLEEAGFKSVDVYDWKDFLPPNYDDYSRSYLPHMSFENGRLMSLNIIALK